MSAQSVPILLYHSIAPPERGSFGRWTLAPPLFEDHMAYLQSAGYSSLTVSGFIRRRENDTLPNRPVVITFDDGFADFSEVAMPTLGRYGMTATLYVTTGFVGGTAGWLSADGEGHRPMLGRSDLLGIAAGGVEIGAHSRTHPQLDLLPAAVAMNEILGSKQDLEAILSEPVTSFAYPHGYHSPGVQKLTVGAGFHSACTVKHTMSGTHDDRFALKRIMIESATTTEQLHDYLSNRGLRIADGMRPQLATRVWREVRRARRAMPSGLPLNTPS